MSVERVDAPRGWDRAAIESDRSWQRRLSPEEVADFEHALSVALACGKSMFDMAPEHFPLGAAARAVLDASLAELRTGRGFQLLRGFPTARWSVDEIRTLFWGVGLQLGVARPQGKSSLFMTDVRDAGVDYRSSTGRGYTSTAALDFHTDVGDVVGLLCIRKAASGGTSALASAVALHNVMLAARPDLVELLYEPFHFSRQGDEAPEEMPYYRAATFGVADGHFACFLRPTHHIENAQKNFPGVPRLTALQRDALALLNATLVREDLCFRMSFEPGDLQLINNYTVIHSRTDFVDHVDPAQKRHLLRLWLALPDGQPLPPDWAEAMKDVASGAVRGGVRGRCITPEIMNFERRMAAYHRMRFRIYDDRPRNGGRDGSERAEGKQ